jgi:hypothetical protein
MQPVPVNEPRNVQEWRQMMLPGFEEGLDARLRVVSTSTGVRVDRTQKIAYNTLRPRRGTGVAKA